MAEGLGGAVEAGKAFVEFLLEDKQFTGKLGQIGQKLSKIGKIGVLATAPLIAALTTCVYVGTEFGAELEDMSARTGIAADELSVLTFIADTFNVSMEDVEHSLRKMQEQLADIGPGGAEFRKTVRGLGVDLNELRHQSPDEQFVTLAAAIGQLEDPTLRAYAAQKLFGKSGIEVLRVLKDGPEAFRKMAADAKRLGVVISDKEVKANDALGTSLGTVKDQMRALGTHISAAIAGPLTKLVGMFQNILAGLNEFVANHPRVVAAIALIAGVMFTLASSLVAVGQALKVISAIKTGATVVKGIAAAFAVHPVLGVAAAAAAAIGAGYLWWKGDKGHEQQASGNAIPPASQAEMLQRIQTTQPRVRSVIASPTATAPDLQGDPMATSSLDYGVNYLKDIADSNDDISTYLRFTNRGLVVGVG